MERNEKGQFIRGTNGNTFEGFGIWYDKKGYPLIWINNKAIKLHVYIWERINGEKPKGYDLHHIDFDKGNYKYENLELLSYSDHRKLHAGWIRNDKKEWILKPCKDCKKLLPLDKFYQRKGLTPSNRCIKCSSVYFKNRNTEEYKKKRKIYMKKYYERNKSKFTKKSGV